jgi:hypothetical protein
MIENIARWLTSLAENTADKDGKTGRLRIYADRNRVPRGAQNIALDRIIEHLQNFGVEVSDVREAIASLFPAPGVGGRVHVVVTTPYRVERDFRAKTIQDNNNQFHQAGFYSKFCPALDTILPDFEYPETVQ